MFDGAAGPAAGISTPGWLRRAALAIAVAAVLAAAAVLWATTSITDTARTIGRDAEPSVALALRMTATLADMNANAVNDFLTDAGVAAGTSRAYRDGEAALASGLVEAARNVTYGEAEAEPLRRLQFALLNYEEAVTESRYLGAGDASITSSRVQWASRVNRDFAAPQAAALADANAGVLEARWAAYQSRWLLGGGAGFAALSLLTAMLAGIQIWLLQRTRRVINPPLALATLVCAAAALWFGSQAIAGHGTLRAAKEDAYDSLHVLFQAKVAVNAIRADTSLWLLDPAARRESEARIAQSQQALLGPVTQDPRQAEALANTLFAAVQTEKNGEAARAAAQTPKVPGLLGTELANVTYGNAEREPATAASVLLLHTGDFLGALFNQAKQDRQAATARWTSERQGGGALLFAAIQTALDRTIAVNQTEFDRGTAAILASTRLLAPVTLAALALTVMLSLGGLWLRLREYR